MAKKKQSRTQPPKAAQASAPAAVPESETAKPAVTDTRVDRLFSVREYLLLNVIFDAFCVLQLVLVRLFLRETRGLYFFFGLIMIGFLLVSIFDYFYDRMSVRTADTASRRNA